MRLGIDVGGTFTDLVLVDDRSGQITTAKVSTTPRDLAQGVIDGIEKVLSLAGPGRSMADVDEVVHGTTIGTNALIERKGRPTGLITTAGFRDVLEIARIQRPKEGLYDITVDTPAPLIPRHLRCEVRERVDAKGEVVVPLDQVSLRETIEVLAREQVEAVAVCLLFGFLNPVHERQIREEVRRRLPGVYVSLASEVAPEFREFERTSTVVINAYLQPIIDRYLRDLDGRLRRKYGKVDLRIMQAGGGTMSARAASALAVQTVNSGPAGGAIAGTFTGRLTHDPKVVSVDMGGTSFDICVSESRRPRVTTEGGFGGLPVKVPVIDVTAIGAGGGSIAWIDAGGALNVGPQSAGAEPGPACYGRGGEQPTVTDANLVVGRIDPDFFLGGEMKLDRDRAVRAVERVAGPLGLPVEQAALGILRIVNANMCKGISVESTERGYDHREFALVAFGGAGPLHAVRLGMDVGMARVIVPPIAYNFSAVGLLVADPRYDTVRAFGRTIGTFPAAELLVRFRELEAEGRAQLAEDRKGAAAVGGPARKVTSSWSADVRYVGQSYELRVPVAPGSLRNDAGLRTLVRDFSGLHRRMFSYDCPGDPVEIISARVAVTEAAPPVRLRRIPAARPGHGDGRSAVKGRRRVVFPEGTRTVPVYDRALLGAGARLPGPCLVEEAMTVTVIDPGTAGVVDPWGNIVVDLRSRARTRTRARPRRRPGPGSVAGRRPGTGGGRRGQRRT